jgi:hypothetical protein
MTGADGLIDPGDPFPDLFPPDDPTARFVVSMSMARNDIERALRDVAEAGENDRPDFGYRVRVSIGHLVEALDALNAYRQKFNEVRVLINRVPGAAKRHLKEAQGSLQRAGRGVLEHARNHTFHYPSPDPHYEPTSDQQLAEVLAAMGNRGGEVHFNGETGQIKLTFADDVALAMAMSKLGGPSEEVMRRAAIARDGALNFVLWVSALVSTYMDIKDLYFGSPLDTRKTDRSDRSR